MHIFVARALTLIAAEPLLATRKLRQRAEYRLDRVLCVESGVGATHVNGSRFRVTGHHPHAAAPAHTQEVTLEAPDEMQAVEWVQ